MANSDFQIRSSCLLGTRSYARRRTGPIKGALRQNVDVALNLFHTSALLELGMESTDGTGSTLAWPLVRAAAALLSEVAEGEDPGPSTPGGIDSSMGALGARAS